MSEVKRRTLVGWTLVLIGLMALPACALEYRLQVTNLDYRIFASYQEHPRTSAIHLERAGTHESPGNPAGPAEIPDERGDP
jgi:hypothetical protein